MLNMNVPEIQRTNLSNVVLLLKSLKVCVGGGGIKIYIFRVNSMCVWGAYRCGVGSSVAVWFCSPRASSMIRPIPHEGSCSCLRPGPHGRPWLHAQECTQGAPDPLYSPRPARLAPPAP